MITAPTTRLKHALEWALLAVAAMVLIGHTLPRAWRTLNTDFPNYYLAAQLAHQHYDTSQLYDWRWLQREKDHRQIDQPIIGLAPITPFSTLFVYPLTALPPLAAKRLWIIAELGLLVPIGLTLSSLTNQPLRRIASLAALCVPLHRNLLYGQFYILLLAMIVLACWAYRRGLHVLAGVLIALATMTKIFPAVLLLYLLRKKAWRALAAAWASLALCTAASIALFGWSLHRTYLQVILPWTLRGEALPPYTLAAQSISTVLHRLFLYEPQWNPHPWHNLPIAAAILAPVLQMLLLAPALLFIHPAGVHDDPSRAPLEWSALLTATLTVSTVPASYNFTLLLFPVIVLYARLRPQRPYLGFAAVLLFLAIGYPGWNTSPADGLYALLHVPRLYLLILFTLLALWTLHAHSGATSRNNRRWALALAAIVLLSIASGVHHQHGLFVDYAYRVPDQSGALLATAPQAIPGFTTAAITLTPAGYRLNTNPAAQDQLSFAIAPGGAWIEQVAATSRLIQPSGSFLSIEDAQSPTISLDGHTLAFLRTERGRAQLFAKSLDHPNAPPVAITPLSMNVLEAAALPGASFLVAASLGQARPQLFEFQPGHPPASLDVGEARYPAISPDGQWLAYSRFQSGAWNLWLFNFQTRTARRLTEVSCNQTAPAWEADSKTLLYASDCGRALGLTALCRRRVIP